ncbi:engulfment and cell motility protein 3 isoform X5 [Rousettus aegyptiacus]|uniref:engulfment and cell motility protein 3 isoform X5 n=1 Tax=Rousettus aegyptiacus TaxID=9407 RepID=UPI00168CE510|nr:engulfment and cell motility protein 3 isoform X5 [Rousettus aegyptiacus]
MLTVAVLSVPASFASWASPSPFPLPQNSNPAQDLEHAPPGLLALDNMLYFSRHAPSAYSRFVLENSSREDKHECPFARSSIQLTVLLCELLRVGEPCSETAQDFSPMFFGQDQSFHELFCVSIQLLNKTWKEMRATQEDFDKVMQVVREQLARTLALKPSSLELFRTKVNALTYGEVLRLRQTERLHQEGTLAPPILELREKLKPELMSLIRQQRLLRLCEGTLFRKISSRRRQDKLWFCCLSPNHKVLQYGDVEDNASPPAPESLPEQLPVADIRALLTGKDCPHIRDKGSVKQNKDLYELAFTISYDHGEEEAYLNFIAPSKREFHLWTDGLSTLLGSPMGSEQTRLDLEQLLTMETKLRLLELENVPIPEQPPPIPPPPTNFNFCYDCSIAEP